MTSPFCELAATYDALWDESPYGRTQRQAVWRELDRVFQPGDRIVDLGCGTGTDAVYLKRRGVSVDAIDASPAMVNVARSRGVAARICRIEQLWEMDEQFDGAMSNFGAVNCVARIHRFAKDLERTVRPGGYVVLCLMGRFCWRELLIGIRRFDWTFAARRWKGMADWRGSKIYYPSVRDVRAAFDTGFAFCRRTSIGGGDHQLYTFRRRSQC